MEVIKKIMDGLQKLYNSFIPVHTGAFIYNHVWENEEDYIRGKHQDLLENQVKFYCNLDGDNQRHLFETLLAYNGTFTIPFLIRMMKHSYGSSFTNEVKPYVRYFSKSDNGFIGYFLFDMPSAWGMKTHVLSCPWHQLYDKKNRRYTEIPEGNEQMYLYFNHQGVKAQYGQTFMSAQNWTDLDEIVYTYANKIDIDHARIGEESLQTRNGFIGRDAVSCEDVYRKLIELEQGRWSADPKKIDRTLSMDNKIRVWNKIEDVKEELVNV